MSNIRYVLTTINKAGNRVMFQPAQGRHTYSKEGAQVHLNELLYNNTPERLEEIFGKQAMGEFQVTPVDCYEGHNDPKRTVFE